ncbi:TPR-like protein [Rhizophagus irregularis]|uniref:TPR-like protein n=1 Tax=Rhizophagus irregularis TaxID=588596 RepID=A0A2N0NN45_9GLOM|nr:TPR-like protein [Rhizophagus irregularis]
MILLEMNLLHYHIPYAIESLNKAPSSFIQFKAVEILLHLHNIDSKMFSMIEDDFDQYIKKLNGNKSSDFSENFQNLLIFVKEKYLEDLKILSKNIGKEKKGKGKSFNQNLYLKREQASNSNVIDIIAEEMTCPVSSEPEYQLCILKCEHTLSLNNLKLLKQKMCPKCREKIEENDIRYLPQNSIYKNLYTKFSESGHIIPPIKSENSDQIYDSDDSDNSEADLILAKKKKSINSIIKLNSNISLSSILSRNSKKQHPTYQNIIKEINEKHYEKAESLCKEFLNFFPKSYSLRCILGYIYRCLKNYEQAHFYLKEAINLKPKKPIAYLICGELFFWQGEYIKAHDNLLKSINYKVKINNLYIILGNIYFLYSYGYYVINYDIALKNDPNNYYDVALINYNIALKNDPNNYLCLKNSAYCCEKYGRYSEALEVLDKLLNINKDDSLILCYYGEILFNMGQYSTAISYFTKANIVDPENTHNLNKRAIAYYTLQDYNKVLLDLDKMQNELYAKNGCYQYISYISCIYLLREYTDFWLYLSVNNNNGLSKLGIVNGFSKHIYEKLQVYSISNLVNLNSKLHQFQENDINSLSEKIISSKNEDLHLNLPNLYFEKYTGIIWKINVKEILNKDCFIKFVIKSINKQYKHVLKYKDVLKLEGLGWIEYQLPKDVNEDYYIQPSIEINGSINMQIDYVRCGYNYGEITYIPNISNIGDLLPNFHKIYPNVPEIFKDKYSSRKEMENLLELEDIINHL